MSTREHDPRQGLLNTLLTTPHRKLTALYPLHEEMIKTDPLFYVHLAAWYNETGDVRDHKEMFVINLVLSHFPGHRDVGLAMLRKMPPYQVGRVYDFIKGTVRQRTVKPKEGDKTGKAKVVREKSGLFRNVPRSVKTEITRYLREREAKPKWFDRSVLQSRHTLKRLYASLHIKPSSRAQAILFDDNPPPDSLSFALKQIAKAESPAEQARAIVEYRIPYRIASTVIKQMTPMMLVALINNMSPQELINNIGSLKRHGAFDNEDIKGLVEEKLEQAKSGTRVSAYKAKVAAEAVGATGDLAAKLDAITEAQVQAKGRITRSTAILIDKSGSMDVALEVGRQLGAMISSICEADLYAYAFDTVPYPILAKGKRLVDWEKAMMGIYATGATSCGVAIEWMRRKKQHVEQIVMVTDEMENRAPRFKDAYQAYAKEMNIHPAVIFVKIGQASNQLETECVQLGVAASAFEFRGDYYALPNVIPMLTYPSMMEMVMEIMSHPLPERKKQ